MHVPIVLAQNAGRSMSINSVVCKSVLKWLIEGSIRLMVVVVRDGGYSKRMTK